MTHIRIAARPVGYLEDLAAPPDWTGAACQGCDTDVWFPTAPRPNTNADWDTPRRICADCPIQQRCLEYAMRVESAGAVNRYGMWGGYTPRERQRLYEERREAC